MENDEGRAAVIVPLGVLFRSGPEAQIRQKLIENNRLDAVIALPEKLFTHTNIPSAILIFKANKTDNDVLFINAENEYIIESRNQNILKDKNIERIVNAYSQRKTINGFSYLASLKELNDKKYNWSVSLYVTSINDAAEIDLVKINEEKKQLKSDLVNLDKKMHQIISELELIT